MAFHDIINHVGLNTKLRTLLTFYTLSQSMRGHFREVQACAMRDVAKCDQVGVVLLGNDTYYQSKSGIWHHCETDHIIIVHESGALPLVFRICHGY